MRSADLKGSAGQAWELEPGGFTKAHWAVFAPNQAPVWNHYIVAVIDLKGEAPNGTNAALFFPDARWEIACWALDPECERPDWPDKPNAEDGNLRVLRPQNVQVQLPDHPAELVIDATRATIVAGLSGVWNIRFEPMFTHDQNQVWQEVLEATIRHPYHHGDDGQQPTGSPSATATASMAPTTK